MSGSNPYQPVPCVKFQHPEWSKNATIYQINNRQFTQKGTFRAAENIYPMGTPLKFPASALNCLNGES